MMSNVIDVGLKGLTKSLQNAENTANDIARAGSVREKSVDSADTNDPLKISSSDNLPIDLPTSVVELKLYEQSYAASARVISVGDSLLGTVLDTLA